MPGVTNTIRRRCRAGKVKFIELYEVSADTIRRAQAVHPITANQVESSPFTLDIEDEKLAILKTARGLGITAVAYSPIGRGLLTGKIVNITARSRWRLRRCVVMLASNAW